MSRLASLIAPFDPTEGFVTQKLSAGGEYDQELTNLLRAASARVESGQEDAAEDLVRQIKVVLGHLETVADLLERITEEPVAELEAAEFVQQTGLRETDFGAFIREDGNERVVLNATRLREKPDVKEAVLHEEYMHVLHYVVHRHLSPTFMPGVYVRLTEEMPVQIQSQIRDRATEWIGERPELTSLAFMDWRRDTADELLAKFAVAEKYGLQDDGTLDEEKLLKETHLSQDDINLLSEIALQRYVLFPAEVEEVHVENFRNLAANGTNANQGGSNSNDPQSTGSGQWEVGAHIPGDGVREVTDEQEGGNNGEQERDTTPEFDVDPEEAEPNLDARNISDIRNGIVTINAFFDANPEESTDDNRSVVREVEQDFYRLENRYNEMNGDADENITEEMRNRLSQEIADLASFVGSIKREISVFDAKQRDLRAEKSKRGFVKNLWYSVEFMSLNDIIAIGKAIMEDVQRQHQRRQQGRIGRVGENLTSWMQKNFITRHIPYLNTLSSEFHRRDKASEVEEVNKWMEALKDVDSYELQEMLADVANKDQLKAILNTLAERGRIDWTDEDFWDSLSRLSRYNMPNAKCRRDESLREDWLRKLITDIFEDKDHYRAWKTQNDGAIESEKNKYTAEADRLSNLSGGLSGELEKQLRIFVDAKTRGVSIPDDVQPHLYEEVLEYSIRNGKMSMEEKFYYLVQGLSWGIMSLDRLRTLAGEKGEILNIFPFIDYFYGKNNTKSEIDALARRLRETGDQSNPNFYKPGMRTTLWLELEVGQEPRVQERLRKGIDRKAGEMDHDDMHMFIPRLDSQMIKAMAAPQGGGRQKMSTDGWRNAYTGYNEYFKSLGMLSQMEEDGDMPVKFSADNVYQTVRAVAGFIQMDGILTVRSNYGDTEGRRPAIPYGEMKNTFSVVTDGKHNVYQDRSTVNIFVREVLEAYQDTRITPEFIDNVLYDTERRGGTPPKEKQDEIHRDTKVLQTYLEKAVRDQGPDALKRILREHMPNLHNAGPADSIDEYNYDNAKRIYRDMLAARRQAA